MASLPRQDPVDFARLFPGASDDALDLLRGLLTFNPDKRLTVEEALQHPFMADIHDPSDEPVTDSPFDFSWENDALTHASVRHMLTREALSYHPNADQLIAQFESLASDAPASSSSSSSSSSMSITHLDPPSSSSSSSISNPGGPNTPDTPLIIDMDDS